MKGNLGQSSLRRKRRSRDPMSSYDGLPAPLRGWLADAALPWSPVSARRIWTKCVAEGLSEEDALASLSRAEERTLSRDRWSAEVSSEVCR